MSLRIIFRASGKAQAAATADRRLLARWRDDDGKWIAWQEQERFSAIRFDSDRIKARYLRAGWKEVER